MFCADAVGEVLSTTNAWLSDIDPEAPGVAKVKVALLPALSLIVPLFNAKADVDAQSKSQLLSLAPIEQVKVNVLVPVPVVQVAAVPLEPLFINNVGVPLVVSTVTVSSKATNTVMVSPFL